MDHENFERDLGKYLSRLEKDLLDAQQSGNLDLVAQIENKINFVHETF